MLWLRPPAARSCPAPWWGYCFQWAGQTQAAVEASSVAAADVSWNEGPHVARLGARLYGRHLLSVELVGVILLAALVGTVAIVERGRPVRAGDGWRAGPRHADRFGNEAIRRDRGKCNNRSWPPRPFRRRSLGKGLRETAMGTELTLLTHYLVVGAVLFGIGLIGFLARRNMIVMFLCLEMMMQGVSLSLVGWGRYHHDWDGQILVIMIIAVAACEAALALALILILQRRTGHLDMVAWHRLREEGLPPHVDREIPEVVAQQPLWPSLSRAGVEPDRSQFEVTHRSRV